MSELLDLIREEFLNSLGGEAAKGADQILDVYSMAELVGKRVGQPVGSLTPQVVGAILEVYSDLFRAGIIAFGGQLGTGQITIGAFRLTEAGRALLNDKEQEPESPHGYLAGIPSLPELSPIARSYLEEALGVFVVGHHRAAAVLLGAVVEVTVLELRDAFVAKLKERGESPAKLFGNPAATAKEVYDSLSRNLRQYPMPPNLAEAFEAHWDSFLNDIRLSRNASGHPRSLEPVTRDDVRAGFLQLRSILKLVAGLRSWISGGLQT